MLRDSVLDLPVKKQSGEIRKRRKAMPHSKNSEKQPEKPDFLQQLVQTRLQEYLEQKVTCHLGALPYDRDVGVFQEVAFDLA